MRPQSIVRFEQAYLGATLLWLVNLALGWKIKLESVNSNPAFAGNPQMGNPETDIAAKSRIESYFPNRNVYLIEMLSSWAAGGGVHCHTNDQPAFSITN